MLFPCGLFKEVMGRATTAYDCVLIFEAAIMWNGTTSVCCNHMKNTWPGNYITVLMLSHAQGILLQLLDNISDSLSFQWCQLCSTITFSSLVAMTRYENHNLWLTRSHFLYRHSGHFQFKSQPVIFQQDKAESSQHDLKISGHGLKEWECWLPPPAMLKSHLNNVYHCSWTSTEELIQSLHWSQSGTLIHHPSLSWLLLLDGSH